MLLLAPHAAQGMMIELAAGLARRGELRVLDGGNLFNAYLLARALRRQTVDILAAMERVSLARAFTCYQMDALLAASPAQPVPTLVLDLPAMYYDESVPLPERQRLLARGVQHLRRLSSQAPVAVSARPAPAAAGAGLPGLAERAALLDILIEAVDRVWEADMPVAPELPPRLF